LLQENSGGQGSKEAIKTAVLVQHPLPTLREAKRWARERLLRRISASSIAHIATAVIDVDLAS
jgi:hypothetical protein